MPHFSQFRLLALCVGGISLLALILGVSGLNGGVPAYVAVAGLALAVGIAMPLAIGAFLRFFIVFYGVAFVALMLLMVVAGWLPAGATSWLPSPLVAFQAAAFGLIAAILARLPLMVRIFAITDPYFETEDRRTITLPVVGTITAPERWIAYVLLGTIIVINLAQVGLTVRLNQFNRDFYDALQNKNAAEFWRQLLQIWVPVISVWILSNIVEIVLVGNFRIRWRDWLTHRMTGRWLDDGVHYQLQFNGGVDNPDQRIQEDIRKYVDSTYALTIQMIQQISTLVSFSVILWGLSANLPVPGTETIIPGMLFWIAFIYAGIGTFIAHRIGRRLISLNFTQEHYEANFRYMLARLREFNEPVALLRGENSEKTKLTLRFNEVVVNFLRIIGVQKWLNAFSSFYGASNSIVPLVILAPFYFLNKVTLGVLIQTATAFDRVNTAFSFIIDRYSTLAEYKAVIDRLSTFDSTIDQTRAQRVSSRIHHAETSAPHLAIPALSLALPDGRTIARAENLVFRRGERTLLVGPSGSGKSTLFRAVAGIWPFGEGTIEKPAGKSVMLLPQRPYIPIGTLKGAVSYPAIEGAHDEAAIAIALDLVRLPQLKSRIGEEANWSQILSGGEQQRLAIARALLAKPDWLFLDEATSALDEPLEDAVYAAIRSFLPETTVVSIGHRSSLIDNHDRRIAMEMGQDGLYRIVEARVPA